MFYVERLSHRLFEVSRFSACREPPAGKAQG
jgi:hypothetical protein